MKVSRVEIEHLVKRLGGRRFPASGRGLPMEDGYCDIFHIQLKVTKKDKYTLKKDDLVKLVKHSLLWRQIPLFIIYFQKHKVYTLIYPIPEGQEDASMKHTKTIHPQQGGVFSVGIPPYPLWKIEPCKEGRVKEALSKVKEICSPLL